MKTLCNNHIKQTTVYSQKFVMWKYKLFGRLKVIAIPTLLVCLKFAWSDFGGIMLMYYAPSLCFCQISSNISETHSCNKMHLHE